MTDLAAKFAGSKSFIPALEEALAVFHEEIARYIRPWQGRVAVEEEADVESADDLAEPAPAELKRNIAQTGQFNGRAFSIFDDGSIEIETGSGIQRFNNFAELTAAAAAKNGHAEGGRNCGRGTEPSL